MTDNDFTTWVSDEIVRLRHGLTLRTPSENQSIFKYVSLDSQRSWNLLELCLNNIELYGSTAADLNDPFEMSPTVFDDLDSRTVASVLKYPSMLDRLSDEDIPSAEEKFADLAPYRKQANEYLRQAARESRIVAFCERPDSGLLWSHYAASYQGACLHFLAKAFVPGQSIFGYVNYSTHRPVYPLSLALSLSKNPDKPWSSWDATRLKRAESEKILYFTKSDEWSYETELRLIYQPSKTRTSAKFAGNSLLSIIAGPRMGGEAKARLKRMVSESPLSKLRIRESRLSKTSFTVEFD